METKTLSNLDYLPRELRGTIWSYLTQPSDIYSALRLSRRYLKEVLKAVEVIDGEGEVYMEMLSKFSSLRVVKPLLVCDFSSLLGPYLGSITTCNIVFRANTVDKSTLLMSDYTKAYICDKPVNIRLMAQDGDKYHTIIITDRRIFSTSSNEEVIEALGCMSELTGRDVHLPMPSPEAKRISHEKGVFKGVLPPGNLMDKWVIVKPSCLGDLSRPTPLRRSQSKDDKAKKKCDLFTRGVMLYRDLLLSRAFGNVTVPIGDMLLKDSVELSDALSIVPPSM